MWFAPRQNGRFDANAELRGSKAASRLYHYAPLNGSLVESGFSLEFPADADGSCDGCCRRLGDVGVCVCVCVCLGGKGRKMATLIAVLVQGSLGEGKLDMHMRMHVARA